MNTSRPFAPLATLVAGAMLASAPLLAMPGVAYAHGSMKPQHGGLVQMSGETLFELVRSPKGVEVYISEEDEPLPAADYTAKLTVTSAAGAKTTTALTAAKANRFNAPGLKPQAGSRVVVLLIGKSNGAKTFATFNI